MVGLTNIEELESEEALNWLNSSPSQHTYSPLWAPTNSSPSQHTYSPLPASLPQPSSSDSRVCHVRAALFTRFHPQNEQHEDMVNLGFYVQLTIHDRGGGVLDVIPAGRLVTINGLELQREDIEESQAQYLAVLMEEKVRSRDDVLDMLGISQDSNLRFLQRTPEYEDMVDQSVRRSVRVRQYQMEYRGGALEVIGDAFTMNGVEIQGLSATLEPSLIFQTTNSRTVWLGRCGQWTVEFHYRWNWLNIGTFKVAEGASLPSGLVIRFMRGKDDLFSLPRVLFLNENRSEPPPQLALTSQEENRNEDFGLGCSEAAGNDEVEAVGNIGSDRTGNSECLGIKKTKEKNPVGERRNKKTNGVKIANPLEDILQNTPKRMRSKVAAKHLKVSIAKLKSSCREYGIHRCPPRNEHKFIRQSLPNETPAVVDQEGIPQLSSHTVPSTQALTATVDTNSFFEKEILPPQFLPTAQQENPDAGLGNDEDEAIGMGFEGTGDGVMVEAQLNSGCSRKRKFKEKSPGGERGNKGTIGVRIAIAKEDILQTKGMGLKDAAKHIQVGQSSLKYAYREYGIPSWQHRKLITQSHPTETPALVDQEGIPQSNSDTLPSDQALAATVEKITSVIVKENLPPPFSPTARPERLDEDFGNVEAEAVFSQIPGIELTPRGERRNKETGGVRIAISLEEILQTTEMLLEDAAKHLKVSKSTLERACRGYDIPRWPPRGEHKLISQSCPNESPAVVDKEPIPQLNSDTLLPSNQVSTTIGTKSVIVKARFDSGTLKFQLSWPWRTEELEEQVKKRLGHKAENYYINYKDEDNEYILIGCDEDLQDHISSSILLGTNSIEVFLQPKPK